MVSMPFFSTLQAAGPATIAPGDSPTTTTFQTQTSTTPSTTTNPTVTAEQAIAEAKTITNTLLQESGKDAGIAVMCTNINAVLSSRGSSSFCSNLATRIADLWALFISLGDEIRSLEEQMKAASRAGNLALLAKLLVQYDIKIVEYTYVPKLILALEITYDLLCSWHPTSAVSSSATPSSVSSSATPASGCSCGQ